MVQKIDKYFIGISLIYVVLGMLLGNVMGATQDHSQMPTHAHIMLLGWATMALSGILYKLWPEMKMGLLPLIQFILLQISCVVMFIGLYLLYGGSEAPFIEPMLAISGMLAMAAMIIQAFVFLTKAKS